MGSVHSERDSGNSAIDAASSAPRGSDSTERLLLSPVEAARRLGIGRSTLYELLAAGEVESLHIGRRRLIAAVALVEFVERRRTQPHGVQRPVRSAEVEASPRVAPPRRSRRRLPSQPQLPLAGSVEAAGTDTDEEAGAWRP